MATKTIDLNRATADEISEVKIEGIDESQAMALVEYRDEHGPFESWEEVKNVTGFNGQLIQRLQESGATIGQVEIEEEDAA